MSKPHELSVEAEREGDEARLKRLREGDEGAFRDLVERWHTSMVRLAMVYVPSPPVAEEVAQETWLAVVQGLDRFRGQSPLKTWTFRILLNRASSRRAAEQRSQERMVEGESGVKELYSEPATPDPHGLTRSADSPEQELLTSELRAVLERAVAHLPERQRLVLTLRDVQGWAAQEVCDLLGLTDANQRIILHRARTEVRSVLEVYLRRG